MFAFVISNEGEGEVETSLIRSPSPQFSPQKVGEAERLRLST
jgi:hypothetical protein